MEGQGDLAVTIATVQATPGFGGRTYALMRARDVGDLYTQAHRARIAVVAVCGAKVLLDISEEPSNTGCMSLERFVRYKCFYSLVTRPEEVDRTLRAALDWMDHSHCDGVRDPRCLPTAVFETYDEYKLDTLAEREKFLRSHRSSKKNSNLTDMRGRTWQVGAYHTSDLLQVAGVALPIGFHWDVQSQRNSVIATGWERWELRGRGYTNVHPDGYVRGGNATKTHPLPQGTKTTTAPRTPRSARRVRRER